MNSEHRVALSDNEEQLSLLLPLWDLKQILEPRQYKNDSIQSKTIPTLKLPRFFTGYMVREKARQFQKWSYF